MQGGRTISFWQLLALIGAGALTAIFALYSWLEPGLRGAGWRIPAEVSHSALATPASLNFQGLVNHDGAPVGREELTGKWRLLFLGYTYCPDICPTALNDMASLMNSLSKSHPDLARDTGLIFLSVDPDRDTPARLKEYASYFHPEIRGMVGPMDRLQAIGRSLGAFFASSKKSPEDKEYAVVHPANIYLVDPQGRACARFSNQLTIADVEKEYLKIRAWAGKQDEAKGKAK
ncbi:MAG: SCO family protein [Magnetococcales bacterium]|nr:SCO family protein [Magnetococcales bacterium]